MTWCCKLSFHSPGDCLVNFIQFILLQLTLASKLRTLHPKKNVSCTLKSLLNINNCIAFYNGLKSDNSCKFSVGGGTSAYEAMLEQKRTALRQALRHEYLKQLYNPALVRHLYLLSKTVSWHLVQTWLDTDMGAAQTMDDKSSVGLFGGTRSRP